MEETAHLGRPKVVTLTAVRPPEEAPLSDDRVLVDLARAGDAEAFTQLLKNHDHQMRGVAWRLVSSPTAMDDVLQDAYLKAWQALGKFRGDATFSSWLYRIVYTTALDHLKAAKRRDNLSVVDPREVTDHAVDVARSLALREALATLPPDQLAVVALVDGEGQSYESVADLLDISAGTVASRLHRARAALRTQLADQEDVR